MYRCEECNQVSKPGERLNKIVTQTRFARYTDKSTGKIVGQGQEIVKEKGLCISCYNDERIDELDKALSANDFVKVIPVKNPSREAKTLVNSKVRSPR